jgi:hypothetical protein
MTTAQAIVILTIWKETGKYDNCKDLHQAEELGIEALKRVKENREGPRVRVYHLLPGETKN